MKYPVLLSAIALLGVGLVAMTQLATAQSGLPKISPPEQQPATKAADSPRRLTINVLVSDPQDLKVAQGDYLEAGQLVADRGRDRQRLQTQSDYLAATLERLEQSTISPPLPPQQRTPIIDPTYLEQTAAIEHAKAEVSQAEAEIEYKRQELVYLEALPNLDPIVMEHEQAKLAALQNDHTAAVRTYQLAMGKRSSAEYDHSVLMANDASSRNQELLTYQRQLAEYEQRLRDRDYQLSQTQLKLDEIDNAIATLAVVQSPYAGRVRRIKWTGQGADGMLGAEITLMVRGTGSGNTVSGQQL